MIATKLGLKVHEFAAAIGVSRTTIYTLPEEMRPHSIWFGKARLVIEPPAEYLQRIAASQSGRRDTELQQQS